MPIPAHLISSNNNNNEQHYNNKLGMVVYACNLQAWEVETGGYIS